MLKLKATRFILVDKILFWISHDGLLLRCVRKEHAQGMLHEFHSGVYRGHYASQISSYKILRVRYYYPILFQDAHKLVQPCVPIYNFSRKENMVSIPLQLIIVDEPFTQWGLDFIEPINPPSSKGHAYIMTTI